MVPSNSDRGGVRERSPSALICTKCAVGNKLWYFLDTNRERLDVPLHHVLLGHPLGAACAGLEFGWVSVTGHWHQNGHVVGSGPTLKLTPRLWRWKRREFKCHLRPLRMKKRSVRIKIQIKKVFMIMHTVACYFETVRPSLSQTDGKR